MEILTVALVVLACLAAGFLISVLSDWVWFRWVDFNLWIRSFIPSEQEVPPEATLRYERPKEIKEISTSSEEFTKWLTKETEKDCYGC